MKVSYGLPYKGSKRRLALKLLQHMPKAENFVDLFCGGCAVAHAALLGSRFQNVYINDLNPMCPQLFLDALQGKYNDDRRWISHEEFDRLKSTDPYVAFVWSFGNNLRNYLYSREVEPLKRAMHYAIFFGDYRPASEFGLDLSFCSRIADEHSRYLAVKHYVQRHLDADRFFVHPDRETFSSSGRDLQLESSERMRTVKNIGGGGYFNLQSYTSRRLLHQVAISRAARRYPTPTPLRAPFAGGQIHASSVDYREFQIPPHSVVYCDIPYIGTDDYQPDGLNRFDYESFYAWCREQREPLFVSSYSLPYEEFVCVAEFPHTCSLSAKRTNRVVERLFVPLHQRKQACTIRDLFGDL